MTSHVRLPRQIDRVGVFLSAVLVVVVFGLPLFRGLGATDLKGDEPIYSFAVDRMLDRGDWLTPKSIPDEHAAFLEKPPLKIWIVAAGIQSGWLPNDEFGHRFWDPVFGVLAFLYVLAIGRRLGGTICGLVAVLVLFVHFPLVYEHGLRSNNMESALLLSYCGGVHHALAWSSATTRWRRRLHPLAVAGWFCLGFMTKFVAALFLPAILVLTALAFPSWRRRALDDWGAWAFSALLAAAVIAPWFVYESRRSQEFWHIILGEHIYRRFTAFLDPNHLKPWHYYLTTVYEELHASRSYGVVVAGAIVLLVETVRRRWDVGALVLLWFVVPMAAISFGTSKLYHYVYPFLPPLALAAGLVPWLLLNPPPVFRDALRRGVEWIGRTSPGRWLQARSPAWRRLIVAIAVVALVVAAWSVFQPVRIRMGQVMLFRNSSGVKPMLLGVILLSLAGYGRLLAGPLLSPLLLMLLVTALPIRQYGKITGQLNRADAPLHQLRDCLLRVQASGAARGLVVQTEDVGHWGYYYYLGPAGFDSTEPRTHEMLVRRLFGPGEERPVLLATTDYARLRERLAADGDADGQASAARLERTPRVAFSDGRMVLLPGPYASCGHPASTVVDRTGP